MWPPRRFCEYFGLYGSLNEFSLQYGSVNIFGLFNASKNKCGLQYVTILSLINGSTNELAFIISQWLFNGSKNIFGLRCGSVIFSIDLWWLSQWIILASCTDQWMNLASNMSQWIILASTSFYNEEVNIFGLADPFWSEDRRSTLSCCVWQQYCCSGVSVCMAFNPFNTRASRIPTWKGQYLTFSSQLLLQPTPPPRLLYGYWDTTQYSFSELHCIPPTMNLLTFVPVNY